MRKVLFASPEIDFDESLFVKRHWPQGNHQCAHRVGENQILSVKFLEIEE